MRERRFSATADLGGKVVGLSFVHCEGLLSELAVIEPNLELPGAGNDFPSASKP
jgi:hypothetical protein